jgi:hypothetical protein
VEDQLIGAMSKSELSKRLEALSGQPA